MDDLNNMAILVVDDEEIMRDLVAKILKKAGYKVDVANSVATAREMLARTPFDMVISDVQMPEQSGFDLLKEIKEASPGTAVIMMTGYADTFTIKDALMLGADEYITKPFKHYEVVVVVERAFWRMQSAAQKGTV